MGYDSLSSAWPVVLGTSGPGWSAGLCQCSITKSKGREGKASSPKKADHDAEQPFWSWHADLEWQCGMQPKSQHLELSHTNLEHAKEKGARGALYARSLWDNRGDLCPKLSCSTPVTQQ